MSEIDGTGSEDATASLPTAPVGSPLRVAVEVIEEHSASICLLLDSEGRLVGTLSDGDVRRAFLAGATLDDPVDDWSRSDPTTVPLGTDRTAVLDLMRALSVTQVPEVDGAGRVARLHLLRKIIGTEPLANRAVILAGGLGTRLREVTGDLPKPMVPVAGRPILERLVLHLVGSGIRDVTLAVGYGADIIEAHFGDGEAHGCTIRYVRESEPLGTAGPLRGLLGDGLPSEPLVVLNGDLVTSFAVGELLAAHRTTSARMTVAVTEYTHEVPYGVIDIDGDGDGDGRRIVAVREKPTWVGMVNAGVYVLDPSVIGEIPARRPVGMTEVLEQLLRAGDRVTAWSVVGDWFDVGRPQDLRRARGT